MKTSTKLVIQPKKPKELSIDLTSEKKPSKDEFILRLKWVDKNTQAKSQHEFDELLALHNTNHYDLEPASCSCSENCANVRNQQPIQRSRFMCCA